MKKSMTEFQKLEEESRQVDWNSLGLLLVLTVPAVVMAVVLFLWPDVLWIAEIPYTAIGILGSFVAIFLSVFIAVRYREKSGIIYVSAGLMAIGVIDGFQSVSQPGYSQFVWLHSIAGICGGIFFVLYVLAEMTRFPIPSLKPTARGMGLMLGGVATVASLFAILSIVFIDRLPVMVMGDRFSNFTWIMNTVPVGLFLFAGVKLFLQYRKTGAAELFLFTAILIFLFQASEVFYFATLWSIIWWFWLAMRLAVYFTVLSYVLKEYTQTSNRLILQIDERKKAAEALRKANDDWRNSFNSLGEAMLIIDRDYNIENINDSGLALTGKPMEKVLGRKCYQVMHGENKPSGYCPVKQTLGSKQAVSIEQYDKLFEKHFSVTSTPIFDEDGEVTKFVCLMNDITKRVEAEVKEKILQEELNLSGRLASIGEVAAGITHEINNPLTSVIAFAQMLERMDVPENIKEAVEVINDGASRIAGIVEKLLTFARRQRPDKEYIDINTIVTSVTEMRSYEMRNNNIVANIQLAADLPMTMANIGQLQQVFLNTIINAEQAILTAGESGEILVKTESLDGTIRITIADDGPGITRGNIDKLFNPFFTTKDTDGGTGLGLSISYGIIEEHGGKIHVNSVLGEGATFIIDLPVIAENKQPEVAEPSRKEPQKAIKANIMVVDDEPNICIALDRLLTQAGHKVETIPSARVALQRLNDANYDLILLDIKMPGMNGIEFYNHIKEIDPSLQRKVICITGDVISTTNRAFLSESGIPCITKPFGIGELMEQVKSVVGG